jgi:hypothetical protein
MTLAKAAQKRAPIDHNEAELREIIATETGNIIQFEKRRSAINDDITASRSKIKALNIDMDAWRAAKRRQSLDPDVRSEFDRSATVCNAALGCPIQADLFKADEPTGNIPDGA